MCLVHVIQAGPVACWYFPVSKERRTAVWLLQPPAPPLIHAAPEKTKATPPCLRAGGHTEESLSHKPHYAALHTECPKPTILSPHESRVFPPSKLQSNLLFFPMLSSYAKKGILLFPSVPPFFWSTRRHTAREELLLRNAPSRPRPLLLSSPHKHGPWQGSLSGAPAILPQFCCLCCVNTAPRRVPWRFRARQAAFETKLGQLVFPRRVRPCVKLCLLAGLAAHLRASSPPPSQPHGKGSSTPRPPPPRSAFPAAGSHRSQLTRTAAPRGDSEPAETPQQLPTARRPGLRFVTAHPAPRQGSPMPPCPLTAAPPHRGWAPSSSQPPARNATFFHAHRMDPTNIIEAVLLWNNRSGTKSPAISQRCVSGAEGKLKWLFYCNWFKANRAIHMPGTEVRHQLHLRWPPVDITLGSSALRRGRHFCSDGSHL